MKYTVPIILFLTIHVFNAKGQIWFGPKVGVTRTTHNYQNELYLDNYQVKVNYNYQAGASISYTATKRYSVYGELLYERIGRNIEDKMTSGKTVYSNLTNHFISLPAMLRTTIGNGFLKFYVDGGIKLSYWFGGNGTFYHQAFESFTPNGTDNGGNFLPIEYRFNYNPKNRNDERLLYVDKPNRVLYGLIVGAGTLGELSNGTRLMVDYKLAWTHSNLATNSYDDELQIGSPADANYYRENYEFRNIILSVSVAYLWNYNASLKRKGSSTNRESNKTKKKK